VTWGSATTRSTRGSTGARSLENTGIEVAEDGGFELSFPEVRMGPFAA